MDRKREKQELEDKIARCRALAEELRNGETAEMICDVEEELRQQMRNLDS